MEYLRKLHLKKKHEFDMATMKPNIFSKNQIISLSMFREHSNELYNTYIDEKINGWWPEACPAFFQVGAESIFRGGRNK